MSEIKEPFAEFLEAHMKEHPKTFSLFGEEPERCKWDKFIFSRYGRWLPSFFATLGGRWHNWGGSCWKCWRGRNHNWGKPDDGICMCCGHERWAKRSA